MDLGVQMTIPAKDDGRGQSRYFKDKPMNSTAAQSESLVFMLIPG